MKNLIIFPLFIMAFCTKASAQKWVVKTNLLYDATSTMNLGTELGLGNRTTLELAGNYNPWTFSDNHKMKHWMVQPEFRLWRCQRFSGSFWGVHTHYARYNWGGMLPWNITPSRTMKENRYEGWAVGGGISYGYHWIIGKRWGMEATIGLGYAYLKYDKYRCETCGEKLGEGTKHYVGPTKAGISLIYFIK